MKNAINAFGEFARGHFAVLLLTGIMAGWAVMAIHAFHAHEVEFAAFATDRAKEFAAALLMALTAGKVFAPKNGNGNGNGAPPIAPEEKK